MKPGYTVITNAWYLDFSPRYIECANYKPLNHVAFYGWINMPKNDEHTVAIFKIKPKSK